MSSTTAVGGTAAPGRGSSTLALLQRIGRSLMLPIAVLPAAGLLLRLGQSDVMSEDPKNDAWISFDGVDRVAEVVGGAGNALFVWLPLLFAVGVAIGFARKSDGSTALAAVVGYMVFHYVSMNMFFQRFDEDSQVKKNITKALFDPANPGTPNNMLDMGKQNPTVALGGIVIGIVTALLYQRYYRIKLPTWLAFFGGRRFVPIITAFASLVLGVIFGFIWPVVGGWLADFGEWVERNSEIGAGVYGVVNRLLLPLGLHHVPNNVLWFQLGDCKVGDQTATGDLNCYLLGEQGAGYSMTGFFPILMFALPAAALAMWHAAPKHRRKAVGGIMFSAALTAFVTGITEPIEFAFVFVAPVLFGVHAILTGVAMALADAFGMKLGFSFSAGAIDMIINGSKDNTKNLVGLIIMGLIFAVIYYFLFLAMIKMFNIPTPGREPEGVETVAVDPLADPDAETSSETTTGGGGTATAVETERKTRRDTET